MQIIRTCNWNVNSRPFGKFILRNLRIGCVTIVVFISLACSADEKTTPSSNGKVDPQRTWLEVHREISEVFEGSYECVSAVVSKRARDGILIGGTSGGSYRPTTSFTEFVFKSRLVDGPREETLILDMRIERDYDGVTGRASPFRIVRFFARDEGEEMVAGIIAYFKKKNLPYEIIDRKKNPNEKPGQQDPTKKPPSVF